MAQGSVLGPLLFLIMIIAIDHDTLEALMGILLMTPGYGEYILGRKMHNPISLHTKVAQTLKPSEKT